MSPFVVVVVVRYISTVVHNRTTTAKCTWKNINTTTYVDLNKH